jgi:hypothetical protein
MCNVCDDGTGDSWYSCAALQLNANTLTDDAYRTHDYSLLSSYIFAQPAMSDKKRRFCTCFKPADDEIVEYTVQRNALPILSRDTMKYLNTVPALTMDDILRIDYKSDTDEKHCTKQYSLSQSDFLTGTYRIQTCGEYILTEDISVNFNAPTNGEQSAEDYSPNSIDVDDLYWWPSTAQLLDQKHRGDR